LHQHTKWILEKDSQDALELIENAKQLYLSRIVLVLVSIVLASTRQAKLLNKAETDEPQLSIIATGYWNTREKKIGNDKTN
jgi:hypothetical protein